ncbi:uncharacterized protein LOC141656565 [Silene latifolia]|uniref:uncharacterized protein LOC141656565 n=1 Tax=Silene latifolia TaxID=37657 RepID=UPI003D7761A2
MDEKWFYITYDGHKFYVVAGEELPYRSCQSKRYITKVMFMCTVSRPIYSEDGELLFDGKIGSSKHISIQQDNARPHIKNNDPEFMVVANSDGFKIELIFQPPNSPDLNVNDLGYFRALQSLLSKQAAKSVDELCNSVMQSFVNYTHIKLNNIFLTLQSVMVEIIKSKGHNDFAIPHTKKGMLAALGILPRNLEVSEDLVRECIGYLEGIGQTEGLEYLMGELGYNVQALVVQNI